MATICIIIIYTMHKTYEHFKIIFKWYYFLFYILKNHNFICTSGAYYAQLHTIITIQFSLSLLHFSYLIVYVTRCLEWTIGDHVLIKSIEHLNNLECMLKCILSNFRIYLNFGLPFSSFLACLFVKEIVQCLY